MAARPPAFRLPMLMVAKAFGMLHRVPDSCHQWPDHWLSGCSGQRAALAGGTTFHIDFVLPLNGDLMAGLKNYWKKASNSIMDYGFHMAITKWSDKVWHLAPKQRCCQCTECPHCCGILEFGVSHARRLMHICCLQICLGN